MEAAHPLELNPWRRAAVVAALVASFELVLLLVAAVALFGGSVVHHAQRTVLKHEPPVVKTQRPALAKPTLTRTQTSVLVLNGNGRAGAASAAASTLRARGYRIGSVGNAPRTDYPTTLVMYRPGFRPEGIRLAHDLHLRVVGPLDGMRPRDLMGAHVVVILGN